jgi:hypothetical protein
MAEVNREERFEGCGEGALGGSALAASGPAYAEILKTHLAFLNEFRKKHGDTFTSINASE